MARNPLIKDDPIHAEMQAAIDSGQYCLRCFRGDLDPLGRCKTCGTYTKYTIYVARDMVDYFIKKRDGLKDVWTQLEDGTMEKKQVVDKNPGFPTFKGFCSSINTTSFTLGNWIKQHEEMHQAAWLCRDIQEHLLVEHGLTGKYNAYFSKFYAMARLGYEEDGAAIHLSRGERVRELPSSTEEVVARLNEKIYEYQQING